MIRSEASRNALRRSGRRFRPLVEGMDLEARVLLSQLNLSGAARPMMRGAATSQSSARLARGQLTQRHVTPASEINAQYERFLAEFRQVEQYYITAINSQSSNTVSVSSSLTSPYVLSSTLLQVQNGSVFGPDGIFSSPVAAIASTNGVPIATFTLTGRSGNVLILDATQLPLVSLATGTTISATVPASTVTSAGSIFPTYIVNRTNQLAIDLVAFFNSTQLQLPKFNAPPRTPTSRGAIQAYVYQRIAGTELTSLQQSLLIIPLPSTAGSDLQIYDAAVDAAVAQSLRATRTGVRQIFAGKLLIPAPPPANRLGQIGAGTSSTGTTGTGGSTGGTTTG